MRGIGEMARKKQTRHAVHHLLLLLLSPLLFHTHFSSFCLSTYIYLSFYRYVDLVVRKANEILRRFDETLAIGPSHFMTHDLDDAWFKLIWKYSIVPGIITIFIVLPSLLIMIPYHNYITILPTTEYEESIEDKERLSEFATLPEKYFRYNMNNPLLDSSMSFEE